ncbi:hypothetical protein HUJ04_000864 [Dendroctonus ponderosae]|nr:hypothetical protein HUJ04_000864 [Dendroctonus ponderosae]
MSAFAITNIFLVFGLILNGCNGFSHRGYKLYEITPESLEDAEYLHAFSNEKFDFWREGQRLGEPTDIMVAPEDQQEFEQKLANRGMKYQVVVEDVESILQQEKFERSMARSALGPGSVTFTNYMLLEEQMAYLRRLAQDYPNNVTVESIGQSHEGRDILILKLSSGSSGTSSPKPAIFIDAGIHCREWIAPPVALYAIQQLVENTANAALYANVDWYIVPNLNPDGYQYTTTVNRLWRKNRRLTDGAECYGTDLNRNFGYQWMVGGASSNPCSETFAGPSEFSEPEARAMRDFILDHKDNIKLYVSFHSFGELLLYPWSYAPLLPDNTEELYAVGLRSVQAIEAASVIGSEYTVNNSAIGLYVAAGVTTDWVKAEAGVDLSYIFELPNGDAPWWFMLPARQIRPVVEETWAGIRALYEYVEEKFVAGITTTTSTTTTTVSSVDEPESSTSSASTSSTEGTSSTSPTTTSTTTTTTGILRELDLSEDSFVSDVLRSFPVYKVYHVTPNTLEQAKILNAYHYEEKFDFWEESHLLGDPSDIMVAPEDQPAFERNLTRNLFDYSIVIDNVERLIQQEKIERSMTRTMLAPGQVTFSSFMRHSEHMAYLRRLAADYPNIATVEKIGESYEGRDILMLKQIGGLLFRISSGPSETSTPKPGILIDAGIHCREWIAPPVALYIIQQLVQNSANAHMYANVDWYIVPNLNPDGYEFTQSNNRLWRKNRRLTEGAQCIGTDLNRNFGYYWMHAGASQDSCSEIYAGPEAFSEPESQAIRDWVLANGENLQLYLSFHSYGEMMLYPWGYAPELPENHEDLHYVGQLAATAIDQASTINSQYRVNSSAILLYEAAGGSDDWVKAEGKVDLSYCVELPDGDAPFFFMIPARQILPAVRETFEGVKAFHAYIEENFWTNQELKLTTQTLKSID